MKYRRILFSSFREEDFQKFALNNYVQIVFGYYFADNVGGFEQTLIRTYPKTSACNI